MSIDFFPDDGLVDLNDAEEGEPEDLLLHLVLGRTVPR